MQNIISPEYYEYLAILFSVLIGTACYIGFVAGWKERVKITWKKGISVFAINLFLTNQASGLLNYYDKGQLRSLILPFVALLGIYIMEYVDKNYEKLFNIGARKIGINIKDTENEQIEDMNYEENIEQESDSDNQGDTQ